MTVPSAPSPQFGGPAPIPPAPSPPPRRTGLILALVGGGLLIGLAVLVVIVLVVVLGLRGGGAGAGGEGSEQPVAATPEEQATAVITAYFDALAAGDSAAALEIAPPLSTDAVQLPAAVYDAALAAAPVEVVTLHEPVVDEATDSAATVLVDYTVGDQAAQHEFSVTDHDGDEVWTFVGLDHTAQLPASLNGLGTTLNGEPVEDETHMMVLPGAYTVALGLEHFTIPEGEETVLVHSRDEHVEFPDAALTEDGLTAFRTAVQGAVDECLAQTTLEAGCGIDPVPATTQDGWTITEGTVTRTLSEDGQHTLDTMTATPSYDEPTYVEGELVGSIDTEMECTKDGQAGICEMWLGGGMSTPHVDMADPELPVTWD